MIKDYKIKLGGIEIPNVSEISVTVSSPADGLGMKTEATFAAEITVRRNASEEAITDIFKLATNGDGRKNIVNGEMRFISDDNGAEYGFDLEKAYVKSWNLNNPSSAGLQTEESFVIKVGKMSYKAPDGAAKFDLALFYAGSK
jgi:hypothetical protein